MANKREQTPEELEKQADASGWPTAVTAAETAARCRRSRKTGTARQGNCEKGDLPPGLRRRGGREKRSASCSWTISRSLPSPPPAG